MQLFTRYYLYAYNALTMPADEEGQSLAEYGLILALIAVVCIAAVRVLGTQISTYLGNLSSSFAGSGT